MPDGKHIIAGDDLSRLASIPTPANRATLQNRPMAIPRTAAKDLELVESPTFNAALQGSPGKHGQAGCRLPKARIVFQNYPLEKIHPRPSSRRIRSLCKQSSWQQRLLSVADATFEGQDGLATPDGATLTLTARPPGRSRPHQGSRLRDNSSHKRRGGEVREACWDLNGVRQPMLLITGARCRWAGSTAYDPLKKVWSTGKSTDQ